MRVLCMAMSDDPMIDRSGSGAYGSRLPRLLWEGLRDRLRGHPARANARWGRLRPPGSRGPVVWIRTGADRFSVAYGAGLLAALRDRRLDLRLVQTFEAEHEDLLALHLRNVQRRAGAGFGPCAHPRALQRAVDRLRPTGLLSVGRAPEPLLAQKVTEQGGHVLVLAGDPDPAIASPVAAAYPLTTGQARRWEGRADYVSPPADPTSLLALPDARPTLRQLVRAREPLRLWWYHGRDSRDLGQAAEAFAASTLAGEGVLFLSGPEPAAAAGMSRDRAISRWRREPPAAGAIILLDDFRWLATLGVSADGIHLSATDPEILWTALAGAAPLSTSEPERLQAHMSRSENLDWVTPLGREAVMPFWERIAAGGPDRRQGENNRRAFWAERRHAASVVEELLDRIHDW